MLIQYMKNPQVKNQQRKSFTKNLKQILDKAKIINVNRQLHPTGTISTTFLKPAGEENPYLWFG